MTLTLKRCPKPPFPFRVNDTGRIRKHLYFGDWHDTNHAGRSLVLRENRGRYRVGLGDAKGVTDLPVTTKGLTYFFHPDGVHVALANDRHVIVGDLKSKKITAKRAFPKSVTSAAFTADGLLVTTAGQLHDFAVDGKKWTPRWTAKVGRSELTQTGTLGLVGLGLGEESMVWCVVRADGFVPLAQQTKPRVASVWHDGRRTLIGDRSPPSGTCYELVGGAKIVAAAARAATVSALSNELVRGLPTLKLGATIRAPAAVAGAEKPAAKKKTAKKKTAKKKAAKKKTAKKKTAKKKTAKKKTAKKKTAKKKTAKKKTAKKKTAKKKTAKKKTTKKTAAKTPAPEQTAKKPRSLSQAVLQLLSERPKVAGGGIDAERILALDLPADLRAYVEVAAPRMSPGRSVALFERWDLELCLEPVDAGEDTAAITVGKTAGGEELAVRLRPCDFGEMVELHSNFAEVLSKEYIRQEDLDPVLLPLLPDG